MPLAQARPHQRRLNSRPVPSNPSKLFSHGDQQAAVRRVMLHDGTVQVSSADWSSINVFSAWHFISGLIQLTRGTSCTYTAAAVATGLLTLFDCS
jgi:hypothetical protein